MNKIKFQSVTDHPLSKFSNLSSGYAEGKESTSLVDNLPPKMVETAGWIVMFSAILLWMVSFVQIGEAIYSYTDNEHREDDFGKELKEIALHQLILSFLWLFSGLILYFIHSREVVSRTVFIIITVFMMLPICIYSGIITYKQYKRYTEYENDGDSNKKAYSTHAKTLFYVDLSVTILLGLILVYFLFKIFRRRETTEMVPEAIEMK